MNYIGYYSAHEETMKAEIVKQATIGEERVAAVVRGATVDCRWNTINNFKRCLIDLIPTST